MKYFFKLFAVPMLKPLAICCYLGLFAVAVHADKDPAEREKLAKLDLALVPPHSADAKLRRAALRAALKSPTDAVDQGRTTPETLHQLSAQERAELRQQLLQQRRSTP